MSRACAASRHDADRGDGHRAGDLGRHAGDAGHLRRTSRRRRATRATARCSTPSPSARSSGCVRSAIEQLGLASPPTAQAATEAPLSGAAATEQLVNGGDRARPAGTITPTTTCEMRLYRYVSYRKPTCAGLTPKIQAQLAGATRHDPGRRSRPRSPTPANWASRPPSASPWSRCPVDDNGPTSRGVTMTTVKRDPESPPILDVPTSALSVEPLTDVLSGGATDPAQPLTQTVTLTDTRCSDTLRDGASESRHARHRPVRLHLRRERPGPEADDPGRRTRHHLGPDARLLDRRDACRARRAGDPA